MEGDRKRRRCGHCGIFQSTPSAWRETWEEKDKQRRKEISIHSLRMEGDVLLAMICTISSYFNPLPPHGGRPAASVHVRRLSAISIHSLRMEGDMSCTCCRRSSADFNPLPPHGGRLVCRGDSRLIRCNFNPLPPHGGRRGRVQCAVVAGDISFHSLRMVGDVHHFKRLVSAKDFNPLPPHGGRPRCLFYRQRP